MRQTVKGGQFFMAMALLMLLSPTSWAGHGNKDYEQAATFQDETGQMVEVFQDYLDRRPHRANQRYQNIGNQLDLAGVSGGRYRTDMSDRPWRLASGRFDGNFDQDGELEAYSRRHPHHESHADQHHSSDLTGLVDQVEDLSEKVKNTFRKTSKRKQSWERILDSKLSGFDQQANQLRDSWKSSHSADRIRHTVQSLKQQSASIDSMMASRPVNAGVKAHWRNLKSKLNQLSREVI